jgi:hypothetical protein
MRRQAIATMIFGIFVLSIGPASAESMRCGKWIVNEESSPAEMVKKCGEPQEKNTTEQDVLGKNAAGFSIKLGVQVIEKWRYKRSPGALPMLVTIVDGKIKSIERTE